MFRKNRLVFLGISRWLGIFVLAMVLPQSREAVAADSAAAAPRYELSEKPVAGIRPGTVIGDAPPKNWSHLVSKSQPRAAKGDLNDVPQLTVSMAKLLSVSIVANVDVVNVGERSLYRLERAALGLGTKINSQDVIINSDTQSQLGAKLGIVARTVLSGTEAEVKLIKQVLRSWDLLIFDVPTIVMLREEHKRLIVRYALVLDATSGQLNTLVWLIDRNDAGEYLQAVGTMNLLRPNMVEDRQLSIDANEFTLGIPSSKAIAMVRIPPGHPIAIPPQLLSVASAPRFSEESARTLDAGLRELIRQIPRDESMVRKNPRPPAAETSRVLGK